jgi:hypothetical protein
MSPARATLSKSAATISKAAATISKPGATISKPDATISKSTFLPQIEPFQWVAAESTPEILPPRSPAPAAFRSAG